MTYSITAISDKGKVAYLQTKKNGAVTKSIFSALTKFCFLPIGKQLSMFLCFFLFTKFLQVFLKIV